MLTVGSLFSGIGGLDLGLERAGMRVLWQSEIDPYASAVLRRHWPGIPNLGDIRAITQAAYAHVLCGGFPCQPFSRAGKRQGTSDDRWLWPELYRVATYVRPQYILVENVTGLATHGLSDILGDLAAGGYDAEWDCIPAAALGAPHIRDRLYLLAYPRKRRPIPPGRTVFAGWTSSQLHAGWRPEPDMARVVDGISRGLDRQRRRLLGQAVVPQAAEWIGHRIMEAEGLTA